MANRFYANRMAIKAISEKEGVDVDIAIRGAAWYDGCAPKGDRKRRCTKRQAV